MNLSIKNSLRNKLILSFFLLSLLPTILIGVINFELSRSDDRTFLFQELIDINETKAHQLISFITGLTHQAEILVDHQQIRDILDSEDIPMSLKLLKTIQHSLSVSDFEKMFIFSSTGLIFSADEADVMEVSSAVITSTAAYRIYLETVRSQQIILDHAEEAILIMGIPMGDAAVILTVSQASIEQMISFDAGNYQSRDSYLIDGSYRILTEPNFGNTEKSTGITYNHDIIKTALKTDSFVEDFDGPTEDRPIVLASKRIDFTKIKEVQTNLQWYIISQINQSEMYASAVHRGGISLIFALCLGAVVITFGYFLLRSILHPIITLREEVSKLAEGDLGMEIQSDRTDEIGNLLNNTDYMVGRIRDVVIAIKSTIDKTNEVGMTIASSVEEQSAISVEQAGSITEISTTMDEFTSSFAQVTENVNSVSAMTEQIYASINESANLIDSMADKIRDINVDNDRDITNIMDLKQRSKDIAKVMEIIGAISDQTKIIAFNAALEASSAGEAGKRFAVVAAEIRKLTENVIESTSSIDQIITEIQNLADQMVLASEKTTKNIQKGLEYSNNSVANIDTIVESIRSASDSTQQIALSVQQQQTAANQIQTGLQELSTGAQQNSVAIQAINETSNDFKRIGRQLTILIKRFRLPGTKKNEEQV